MQYIDLLKDIIQIEAYFNIKVQGQFAEGQVIDHLYEQYSGHIEQSELIYIHLLGVN